MQSGKTYWCIILIVGIALGLTVVGRSSTVDAVSDVIVIAHPEVEGEGLRRSEITNIYLGKAKTWPKGGRVVIGALKTGTAHATFTKRYTHKTTAQFAAFWKRLVFTGKGVHPRVLKSETAMVAFVRDTKNAIGYISPDTAHDGVTVISPVE